MGKVEKLIVGKDGKVRGAWIKINTDSGRQSHIYRPVQKLIPFEIAENSGDARGESQVTGRMRRRAAIEGQEIRRLRETYD